MNGDSLLGAGDSLNGSGAASDAGAGGSASSNGDGSNGASGDGGSADTYDPEPWYGDASAPGVFDPTAPTNVPVQLATGQEHTCARMQDGTVRCWGDDLEGQLGGGSRLSPVPGVANVVSIAAGLFHTCALTASGTVLCWGANLYNQLGDGLGGAAGSEKSSATAVNAHITAGKKAVRIFGLSSATCVQLDDNQLQCWGAQSYNLDAGTLGSPFAANLAARTGTAAQIVAMGAVQYNLSTNYLLMGDGTIFTALQTGTTSAAVSFVQKAAGDDPVAISGGSALLAVTASGKLFASARNNAVFGGKYCRNFGCGVPNLRSATAACFCAGDPNACLDGNCSGTACIIANTPAGQSQCERNEFWSGDLWLPLDTGHCSTMSTFVKSSPNLTNDPTESQYDGPNALPPTYDDSSESACEADIRTSAGDPGLCAALGNGDATACTLNPIFADADDAIAADHTSRFIAIGNTLTASSATGYACALKSDGHVYCWGDNTMGQLGQGNIYTKQGGQYSRPALNLMPVTGPVGVVELQVGASHACARTQTNQVYCWGENSPASPSSRVGNAAAGNGDKPLLPLSFVPPTTLAPAAPPASRRR